MDQFFQKDSANKQPALYRHTFTWQDLPHKPEGFERAAAAVARLYQGQPVQTAAAAEAIGVPKALCGDCCRVLKKAERFRLVQRVGRSGWVPVLTEATKEV